MRLSEIAIRRPVLATVMSLVILLFGAVSFFFLGVREYPARVKCASLCWHTLNAALAHEAAPVTTE